MDGRELVLVARHHAFGFCGARDIRRPKGTED